MSGALAILAVLLPLGGLAVARSRLLPFQLVFLQLSLIAVGFISIGVRAANEVPAELVVVGLAVLGAGYLAARRSRPFSAGNPPSDAHATGAELTALSVVGIVLALLVGYHFNAVGIPLLASDIETRRFDFLGSGLFGLPGRAMLFGVVVFFFLTIGYLSRYRSRATIVLAVSAFALLAITRLASGFRSSLLELILFVAIAHLLSGRAVSVARAAAIYTVPVAIALFFAVGLSGRYETIASGQTGPTAPSGEPAYVAEPPPPAESAPNQSLQSRVLVIGERATGGAAGSGFLVLAHRQLIPDTGNSLLNDLRYYIPRYLQLSPAAGSYPFVKIVSATLYGTPLARDSFIVPVTIGAFPTLYFDFGLLAFPLYLLLGALYAVLERRAVHSPSPLIFTAYGVGILALNDYLTKGDLIFDVLNWTAMLLFVAVLFVIIRRLAGTLSWTMMRLRPSVG